jgi:hypothetical protein
MVRIYGPLDGICKPKFAAGLHAERITMTAIVGHHRDNVQNPDFHEDKVVWNMARICFATEIKLSVNLNLLQAHSCKGRYCASPSRL